MINDNINSVGACNINTGRIYTSNPKWEYCAKCGTKLQSDWTYCPKCAHLIGYMSPWQFYYPTYQPWNPYQYSGSWTCGSNMQTAMDGVEAALKEYRETLPKEE